MKKFVCFLMTLVLVFSFGIHAFAVTEPRKLELSCKSAVLMEAKTGTVLYSEGENDERSPASVTKVMTLLLVMEALDNEMIHLTDTVGISEYAASMGGSQVFLEPGEKMTVEDLIKCTVISSANDAAVALAELVGGSEETFVAKMNEKCVSLGLEHTRFENVTGLDDTTTAHYSSALDIAKMSSELIRHPLISKYASLWQDSIRNGEFILTNTNRLVRFYDGCNGLKTGSTDKAGFCVSAAAKRGNLQLIAVVMGAENREARNADAKKLLDFGFSTFELYEDDQTDFGKYPVSGGTKVETELTKQPFYCVVRKGEAKKITKATQLPKELSAPLEIGKTVGSVTYQNGDTVIGTADLCSAQDVPKIGLFRLFGEMVCMALCGPENK